MLATTLRIAAVIALAAILPWLAHAASSPDHGPEAQARCLERCADDIALTPSACSAHGEALQRRPGYAGFMDCAAARRPGPMMASGRPRF